MIPSKICKKCGVMQYILEFRLQKDGYYKSICRLCENNASRKYKQNNKDYIKLYNKEYKKQYVIDNAEEIKKKVKIKYWKNKEKNKIKKKEEYEKRKIHIIEYGKNYRQKNKELIRNKKREYKKEKRKNDMIFSLRESISRSISRYLQGKNANKNNKSCLNYLPYTIAELKLHIESLFDSWMTWDNWGTYDPKTYDENPTWNIDHIIPHSTFNYDSMEHSDFQKCWALSNLRPYSSKLNITEGARNMNKNKKE